MRAPTRRQELVVSATEAVIFTTMVVVAVRLGEPVLVALIAGAGSIAVVIYVAIANRLIHDAREHG